MSFERGNDTFAEPARTLGKHPNAFVFDPRPLWRLLGQSWDVIDIHEEPCSLATAELLLLRLLRRTRPPFVLYSAQNIDKQYPLPFRWIESMSLGRAAAASVCNRAAGKVINRKGFTGQLAVIPLGVDASHYAPAVREPPSGALRIGYVGRLATHKGVHVLLESLVDRPTWTLELVGGGPADAGLRHQAATLGITDRVIFRGAVDQDALPDLYRSFDVVVVPSIPTPRWEEQFCRVAVESMASGVPLIASRSGALPEVIGDAGVLVEAGSHTALREALDELSTDAARWTALRSAGLARVGRFGWASVADQYVALYESIAPS